MRKMMAAALVVVVAGVVGGAWGQAAEGAKENIAKAADLPMRRVVLFTSGTGFFEHTGTVDGTQTAQLSFTISQINDVLKSLVVQDADGGTVGGVRYGSQKPLAKALQSFQVDLSGDPGLANLLTQIRGTKVGVKRIGGEPFSGKVLGVERRKMDGGKEETKLVLNMLEESNGLIMSVDLNHVTDVQILDEKLRNEIAGALEVVAMRRDRDKKPVSVTFDGKGQRRVRLGYVVEAPVWKTSYRLMLPTGKGGEDAGVLQGWAIVENATESDWKDVSLTLVGGRPMSFIQNLYASYYVPRPVVQPKSFAGLKPAEHEDGVDMRKLQKEFEKFSGQDSSRNQGYSHGSLFGDTGETKPPEKEQEEELSNDANDEFALHATGGGLNSSSAAQVVPPNYLQGVAALAEVQKVGDSFQFTVEKANLPRQQSAMFPIMSESVKAERVSVYNDVVLRENAMHGVILTNTSKSYVRGGPVAIMNESSYVGDSLVSDLPPGQHRLLSYGVDQELQVLSGESIEARRGKVSIKDGVLIVQSRQTLTTTYTLENRGDKDRVVIVEHMRLKYDQDQPTTKVSPTPDEVTELFWRFRTAVPASKTTAFKVAVETLQEHTYRLVPEMAEKGWWQSLFWEDRPQILIDEMPPAVKKAIEEYIEAAKGLANLDRKVEKLTEEKKELVADQTRVRENLKAIEKDTEYYSRQIKKLQEIDDRIEAIDTEISSGRKAKEALEAKAATINAE
ncbi:MAG: hypothetical protein FWD53_01575 [Phycisphaerales bacterium]|nr:hypothetical protein [Phycisphaerales bacterium]